MTYPISQLFLHKQYVCINYVSAVICYQVNTLIDHLLYFLILQDLDCLSSQTLSIPTQLLMRWLDCQCLMDQMIATFTLVSLHTTIASFLSETLLHLKIGSCCKFATFLSFKFNHLYIVNLYCLLKKRNYNLYLFSW